MQKEFIPFQNIGLCFSGGGYRATFFSLGVVSYLEKIHHKNSPLIKHLEAISTVSGGTLFGIAYSKAAIKPDYKFEKFFTDFYNSFEAGNDKLLEKAINKLTDDKVWKANPHKKRSLINAFALTYADMDIYKGDFEMFKESEIPKDSHLKHVCFNATDFSFGLAFRFQNRGFFGNKPLNNKQLNDVSSEVQLADIAASSSCFPLGFEPLVFPDDYFKDQQSSKYKALKSLNRYADGVGIMDGGIADNQGIGSMMSFSSKKTDKRECPLDLIIVSDVASFKMTPWKPAPKTIDEGENINSKVSKLLSYFQVKPIYWITFLLGVLIMVLNSLKIIKGQSWPAFYIIGTIIATVGFLATIAGFFAGFVKGFALKSIASLFKKNVPEPLVDDVLSFKKLSLSLVKRMLTERISSSVIMINDIFLKQIRRLNYDYLYDSASRRLRAVTSTVYQLNGVKTPYLKKPSFNDKIATKPSTILENVALTASKTPTTLWWDKKDVSKHRMDTLIACGQFTTCYNLMDYIINLERNAKAAKIELSEEEIKAVDDLYKALEKDWKEFNKNPMFHVDALKAALK